MKKDHVNEGTTTLIEGSFIPLFEEVVRDYSPEMIVELGTGRGGLTKHFLRWCPDIPIFTLDQYYLLSSDDALLFADSNVTVIITSQLFNDNNLMPLLLSSPVKKFLFCDNGSKVEEVRFFSGFLRPGDMLGCHDWGEDIDYGQIANTMGLFVDHPINQKIEDQPGLSCCRFWIKRKAVKTSVNRFREQVVDRGIE